MIRRVARGLYEVRDATGTSQSSLELLLAGRFADAPHLVTGWWALGQARLTNQDVREVIILSESRRRSVKVFGRQVRVVVVAPEGLWGGVERPSGLVVASPERALCDAAGRVSCRVPPARLAEVVDGLLRTDADAVERLTRAVERFGSPVVARRLGFITERVAGATAAEPMQSMLGSSRRAEPLGAGDADAPIDRRWHVRTHLGDTELLEHRRVS